MHLKTYHVAEEILKKIAELKKDISFFKDLEKAGDISISLTDPYGRHIYLTRNFLMQTDIVAGLQAQLDIVQHEFDSL